MLAKLAFLHTTDERFIVLSEILSPVPHTRPARFSVTTYDHENSFLALAATAGLEEGKAVDIIANVLLSVSQPVVPHRWVDVDLQEAEIKRLRLLNEIVDADNLVDRISRPLEPQLPFGEEDQSQQFYSFLMQAPTPFVMLQGAEHRVTFINPPYVRLMSRMTDDSILGKTIREVLPELEGQPFFDLLDRVYTSGTPFVGVEIPGRLKSEFTGEFEDCFFDFIYHPLRNHAGIVTGIMAQATEVTERVLAREVSESREQKLYTQWLELEAIYNTAPVGIALFNASDLKVCRINEVQAGFMGMQASALLDKSMKDENLKASLFGDILERAARGESVKNAILESAPTSPKEAHRSWLVSITPFLDKSGTIDKLLLISLEIPEFPLAPLTP